MIIVSTDKRQRPPPYHERPFNLTPFRFSQVCCYSCLCAYASLLASFQTLGSPASTFRRGPPIRSKIGPLLGEGIEGNSDFWESLLLSAVTFRCYRLQNFVIRSTSRGTREADPAPGLRRAYLCFFVLSCSAIVSPTPRTLLPWPYFAIVCHFGNSRRSNSALNSSSIRSG